MCSLTTTQQFRSVLVSGVLCYLKLYIYSAHNLISLQCHMGPLRSPQNCHIPLGDRVPHLMHGTFGSFQSSSQQTSGYDQQFLYGSQMLSGTMHCQWGIKSPKLPLHLDISSKLAGGGPSHGIGIMHNKIGKDREICSRKDRQTHTHTYVHITILRHRCRGRNNKCFA